MSQSLAIQMGLFEADNQILGLHTVAAHTRVLEDGTEVFVGEHVRWNRPRKPRAPRASRRKSAPPPNQPSLFDAPPPPPSEPTPPRRRPMPPMWRKATQLSMWR